MKLTTLHFIRRWFAAALLSVFTMLGAVPASAATGDLVVICYNSDLNDDFALIALANLPVGARYFITDSGWSTSVNNLMQEGVTPSTNQQIQFDVIKPGGILLGTVIKFDQSGANVVLTDPSLATLTMVNRFAVTGTPLLTKLSFNALLGDQILIYQTAGGAVTGTITMVSAFNGSTITAAANPPDGAITITDGWQVGLLPRPSQGAGNSESNLPAGLIAYTGTNAATATAFGLASFPVGGLTNQDNYKYNGPYGLADKTAYLTAINNPANWVSNDTVPYDLSGVGPGPGAAEINLTGNATNIADGSTTPLAADHTHFGSTTVTGGTLTRTFTIQNVGTANLTIPAGAITFSGTNAAEFTASGLTLPAVIAPAGSTTFVVTFDPAGTGFRTATVNIVNDDSNENPYNFALQGYGFNYTPPAGAAPPFRWSSALQNTNVGATRAVGSTTSGDIIAATKINSGTAGNIRVTRHAGVTGAVVWTRDLDSGNSDDVNDMVVDPATGDTYIAARASVAANLNWYVHKVNGNGTVGWTYTFDGATAGADECYAIGRASDGNVVVAGATTTATGNLARVAKINASTGASMNVYTSPTNFSQFNAIATDGAGNTFVTGFINDPVNGNGLTVKLNSTLGQVWVQTFDGAALFDSFSNVTVLPSGDCAVGGSTRTTASNSDAIVIRYAAGAPGTEVWRRVIAGATAGSDTLNNLTVDAIGDLYVAGSIANIASNDRDAYVSKITNAGASAWITTRLGTAPDSPDRFQNVRVSGTAVYAVGAFDNANRNILTSRFNAGTGVEEWTFNFNGSGNGADDVYSGKSVMTLLGTNAIAIGGETFDVSGNTYGIVMKYAPIPPPTVTNVSKGANEDVAATFATADFTPGGYSDPEGTALATVRITSLPANGVLRISGSTFTVPQDIAIANIGNLTYTSNLNYNGADSFGWNGSNGTLFATSAATVNVTVAAVNDKPTFTAANPAAVNEDAGAQSVVGWVTGFSAGPANEVGQGILGYAVSSVSNPSLFAAGPSVASNGTLSYTPAANANGTSTFQVRVQDSGGVLLGGVDTSDPQTFTVTVNAVNDVPVITGQNVVSTAEETPRAIVLADLLVTDVDNAGYPAGFTLTVANGTNYTRSGNTITPALNFNGTLTVPVTVTDPAAGVSASFNLSVSVTPVNDAPVITGQAALSTAFNTARSIALADLTVTDVDNTYPTGFTLSVQNGTNYTRVGNTITPALNFVGTLSVPAQVNDGAANSNIFNLVVTVNPSLLAAQNGSSIAPEPGGGYRISFLGNPGQTYTIQFTTSLAPVNWQFLATRTADANGRYSIVNIPPPGTLVRFYRSIFP